MSQTHIAVSGRCRRGGRLLLLLLLTTGQRGSSIGALREAAELAEQWQEEQRLGIG